MALTSFSANVENITPLHDNPITGGDVANANELKALFDKAGKDIKTYINGTLKTFVDALQDGTKQYVVRKQAVTIYKEDWGADYTNGFGATVEVSYNVYKNWAMSIYLVRPTPPTEHDSTQKFVTNAYRCKDLQFYVGGGMIDDGKYLLDIVGVGTKPTASIKLEIIRVQLAT